MLSFCKQLVDKLMCVFCSLSIYLYEITYAYTYSNKCLYFDFREIDFLKNVEDCKLFFNLFHIKALNLKNICGRSFSTIPYGKLKYCS